MVHLISRSSRYLCMTSLYSFRALQPPGYFKDWHVGVRVASNKRLVAFIGAIPITLRIRDKSVVPFTFPSVSLDTIRISLVS